VTIVVIVRVVTHVPKHLQASRSVIEERKGGHRSSLCELKSRH
jgi:hypothetical protein